VRFRIKQYLKKQNWTALIREVVIVFVGILVTFQVERWHKKQQDVDKAYVYLGRTYSDLNSDVTTLDQWFGPQVIDFGETALDYLENGNLENGSASETLLAFYQASQVWTFVTGWHRRLTKRFNDRNRCQPQPFILRML